jgi:hypothetical protein
MRKSLWKTETTQDLFGLGGAVFSSCNTYRYRLWRVWDDKPPAVFIMLNPSTADAFENDPTVERCERRARAMGYGGLRVANIFALRSTDPKALYKHPQPIGTENDQAILESIADAGIVICAWGSHGNYKNRGNEVIELIRSVNITPHYLAMNLDSTPKHPLYVSYNITPTPWKVKND